MASVEMRSTNKQKCASQFYEKQQSQISNMTSVSIAKQVAPNVRRFGGSLKTIFRWKESVYKLLWKHMLIYYILYVSISALYYFVLNPEQQKTFRKVTTYMSKDASSFNMIVMLGFFTSSALKRLFKTQSTIPGTAKVISAFVLSLKPDLPGASVIIERFSRWTVLSWLLAFRIICKPLREMYPDMIALQRSEFITESERIILERVDTIGETTPRPLIVIDWMLLLLKDSLAHDRFLHKSCYAKCLETLFAFKKACGTTIRLTAKNIPHAVIQAVIISVYFYATIVILARELPCNNDEYSNVTSCCTPLNENNSTGKLTHGTRGTISDENSTMTEKFNVDVDFIFSIIPIMPAMKFFIFFSWLTFGQAAVNPFGDDYTDIDIIQLLNAHLEDAKRLNKLYSGNLDELFPSLSGRDASAVAIEPSVASARRSSIRNARKAEDFRQTITVVHQTD